MAAEDRIKAINAEAKARENLKKVETDLAKVQAENAKKSRLNLANSDRNFSPCNVCDTKGSLIGKAHADAWKKLDKA